MVECIHSLCFTDYIANWQVTINTKTQTLSIRTCEQIGSSDGYTTMFNIEIYKLCGDNYTNSFISGCEQGYKDLGFVFVRCERVAEANINRN